MRKPVKMMLISNERTGKNGRRDHDQIDRSDYRMDNRLGDDMESRRSRDRYGRFTSGMDYPEMGGREYRDTTHMNQTNMGGGYGPYMGDHNGQRYGDGWELRRLVGFERDNGMDMTMHSGSDASMPKYYEADRMSGHAPMMGKASAQYRGPMTEQMAREWTAHMENEDGTVGPHWTRDQTDKVLAQHGLNCDPLEFWVTMNMLYSDYVGVAKKVGANTIDFYVGMAKAFLDDKDAAPGKLTAYYEAIAKK